MKNSIKFWGIITLAALVMFAVVACEEPEDDPKLPSELQNTRWVHTDGHRMTFGTDTVTVVPKSGYQTLYKLKENQSVNVEGISQNNLVFGDNAYITYRDGNIQLVYLGSIQESGGWSEYISSITNSVVSQLSGQSGGGSTGKPVTLSLSGYELTDINCEDLVYGLGIAKKYVALDLSGCSGSTFSLNMTWSGYDASKYIVSLILPETVMSISCSSFPNLTSVSGASSATSIYFSGCTSLTSVNFPAATTVNFFGCTSLTSASFPAVISIGVRAFGDCTSLTSASFPAVISIGVDAFGHCTSLTSASFPAATSIGNSAFFGCTKLPSVSFPSATSIDGYAFYGCTSLTTMNIPKVTSIGNGVFINTGTTSLTITLGANAPNLNYELFFGVNSAKNVTVKVPNGATGYGTIPQTYSGNNTTENWGNGFRGAGWDGSAFSWEGAGRYINSNITLTVQRQ